MHLLERRSSPLQRNGLDALFFIYVQHNKGPVAANVFCATVIPVLEVLVLPWMFGSLIELVGRKKIPSQYRIWTIILCVITLQCTQMVRDHVSSSMVPSFDSFVKVHLLDLLLANSTSCNFSTSGDVVFLLTTITDMTHTWLSWINDHIIPYTTMAICVLVVFGRLDNMVLARQCPRAACSRHQACSH